jgi:ribosomal protein S18 acetylase RimI-like enzyme
MYIAPEHRGRGLVVFLLEKVAEAARDAAAIELRLYAHGSNRRALDAYRRCGFEETQYVIMQRSLRTD